MSKMLDRSLVLRAGAAVASIIVFAAPQIAAAGQTAPQGMSVTAAVVASCTVATPNTLAFGNYATASASTAQADFTVNCTNGAAYNIGFDAGAHVTDGATTTTRILKGAGTNVLNYTLWQNVGLSTNWGNSAPTDTKGSTGTGSNQTFTVYGQIAAGQNAAVDNTYADTVNVTVYY